MRAQELRIGNLVAYQDGRWFKVYEIDELGLRVRNSDEDTWIEHEYFEPIPLTPEILEKAGFVKESLTGLFIKYSLNGVDIWHNVSSNNFLLDNIKNKKVYIRYIHQLQNLIYALTGEELNVQL